MVIDEALRLDPPAWIFGRQAIADDVVGGYHIPRARSSHRARSSCTGTPRTDRTRGLRPERFLPDVVQGRHKYAYIPSRRRPALFLHRQRVRADRGCASPGDDHPALPRGARGGRAGGAGAGGDAPAQGWSADADSDGLRRPQRRATLENGSLRSERYSASAAQCEQPRGIQQDARRVPSSGCTGLSRGASGAAGRARRRLPLPAQRWREDPALEWPAHRRGQGQATLNCRLASRAVHYDESRRRIAECSSSAHATDVERIAHVEVKRVALLEGYVPRVAGRTHQRRGRPKATRRRVREVRRIDHRGARLGEVDKSVEFLDGWQPPAGAVQAQVGAVVLSRS